MPYAEINPDAVRAVSPLEQALDLFLDGRFEIVDLNRGAYLKGSIAAIRVVEMSIQVRFRRLEERFYEGPWQTTPPVPCTIDTRVFDQQRRKDMIKLCFGSESLPGVSITFIPCNLMRMLRSTQAERDGRTRKSRLLARTIDALLPLIDAAQLDAIELAEPAEVDQDKLKKAIGKMYDLTVHQVIPISLSKPDRSNWPLVGPLDPDLHPGEHLASILDPVPMMSLDRLAVHRLEEDDLYNEVHHLIADQQGTLGHAIELLRRELYTILAFAITGQHKYSDRCRDLIPYLPHCFPIGPLKGDSSIWFVAFR